MAEPYTLADLMRDRYGDGYTAPALNSGDTEIFDTSNIVDRVPHEGALTRLMRSIGERFRRDSTPDNVVASGLDTAANWLDHRPRVGQDTIAPLGAAGLATAFATPGAVGVFGGRLARTADQAALRRAEEMAASGSSRSDILKQTGWFQGVDGKWRFEIDDSQSALTSPAAALYAPEAASNHAHLPAASILEHPALYDAYPEIARMPSELMHTRRNPGGSYNQGRLSVSARTPEEAREFMLHEVQHAIQGQEGFARGANLSEFTYQNSPLFQERRSWESPRDAYQRVAGEVEARNVQKRAHLDDQSRRYAGPWFTQDVPDAEQILRQNGSYDANLWWRREP